jgi:hypothetical protein
MSGSHERKENITVKRTRVDDNVPDADTSGLDVLTNAAIQATGTINPTSSIVSSSSSPIVASLLARSNSWINMKETSLL